jgi:nucleotide-binding universal stress UspA family protein
LIEIKASSADEMQLFNMKKAAEPPRDATTGTYRSEQHHRKWGPILVGTDGSEGADRAVDAAGALAADLGTDLWIIHVIDGTSDLAVTRFAQTEKASIGDATEAAARDILIQAARRAENSGARKPRTVLRWGSCADELVAAAGEVGATAILVGRRGAGGRLAQALIGSVSQKLAGISPVYLVIVP